MTSPAPDEVTALYTDRAHILALLALHYPGHLAYSDPVNPDWPVLTLETPHGQLSWHISRDDLELFDHVRRAPADAAAQAYDGHTTADKHARIMARIRSFPPMVNA